MSSSCTSTALLCQETLARQGVLILRMQPRLVVANAAWRCDSLEPGAHDGQQHAHGQEQMAVVLARAVDAVQARQAPRNTLQRELRRFPTQAHCLELRGDESSAAA